MPCTQIPLIPLTLVTLPPQGKKSRCGSRSVSWHVTLYILLYKWLYLRMIITVLGLV